MKRREFIRSLSLSCLGLGASIPFSASLAQAQISSPVKRLVGNQNKVLIHLYLEGGLDALSFLVPYGSTEFAKYTQVRNANTAAGRGALTSDEIIPVAADNRYGFHKNLQFFSSLFNSGKVAIFNRVGLRMADGRSGHSGSHDDAEKLFQVGNIASSTSPTGWLGRLADQVCSPEDPYALFSFRGIAGDAKAENIVASTVQSSTTRVGTALQAQSGLESLQYANLNNSQDIDQNQAIYDAIRASRNLDNLVDNPSMRLYSNLWGPLNELVGEMKEISELPLGTYHATPIAGQFMGAAKLLKAGKSPLAILLKQTAYDHHASLLYNFANNILDLDQALSDFYRDLFAMNRASDVILIIESEFGRRFDLNSAGGVDHGSGGLTIVIGENINGGIYGEHYTGDELTAISKVLSEQTDFRTIRADILSSHLGLDPAMVFTDKYQVSPYKGQLFTRT